MFRCVIRCCIVLQLNLRTPRNTQQQAVNMGKLGAILTSAPKWAVEAAMIPHDSVIEWVEGSTQDQTVGWFPPILLVTQNEVIHVTRSLIRKQSHRIPRNSLRSIDYHQGIIWDTLTLNVAGGDRPNTVISIFRKHRRIVHRILQELRLEL